MKTLKQILKKKSIWYFNASPQTNDFLEKEIILGITEWLEQKKQDFKQLIEENPNTTWAMEWKIEISFIDELLEELDE